VCVCVCVCVCERERERVYRRCMNTLPQTACVMTYADVQRERERER
jgi:hypothetical protein